MRKSVIVGVGCIVLLLTAPLVGFSQSAGPHAGVWKLNIAKSTFPGPPPKSQTATILSIENGLKSTVESMNAKGQATRTIVMAKFDGKEYPVEGTQIMRTYKRIDDRTYEQTNRVNGKVTATARVMISPDGKTRTITSTAPDAQGQPVVTVMVYDRLQ